MFNIPKIYSPPNFGELIFKPRIRDQITKLSSWDTPFKILGKKTIHGWALSNNPVML